jgi:hypothetical protein
VALSGEEEKPKIEGLSRPERKPGTTEDGEEEGMSRLLKAKRRAAEEYRKEEGQ